MKKLLSLFVALIYIINANAQFAVTTNSGSGLATTYTSLANAITALNAAAITSSVVITCPTGTETSPAGGYSITASGTATITITIVGNGSANSVITAPNPQTSGGALNDGIFKIIGGDYITIEGFGMYENVLNTTTAAGTNNMTEFGVALFYAGTSATANGAKFNNIKNCTIDLDKTYQNTFGIYSNNSNTASAVATADPAATTAGNNEGLVIIGNTITDINQGIVVYGPSITGMENDGLIIGGSSLNSNTISNFGTTSTYSGFVTGTTSTVNGILIRYVKNITVSNNLISTSATGPILGNLYGIYNYAGTVAPTGTFTNNFNNNNFSLKTASATATIIGIRTEGATVNATTTLNINNNNFTNFGHSVSGTAAISCIVNTALALTTNINYNTFTNLLVNTTASFTFISSSLTMPAGGSQTVNNNEIVGTFEKTGIGSSIVLFTTNASSPSGTTSTNSNNNFSNIKVNGATGIGGWINRDGPIASGPTKSITNNVFKNWTGGKLAVTALTENAGSSSSVISGNIISKITGDSLVNGVSLLSNTAATFNNNIIDTLTLNGAGTLNGLVLSGTTVATTSPKILKNKFHFFNANSPLDTINGIAVRFSTAGSMANVLIANNTIGNFFMPNGSGSIDIIRGVNISTNVATTTYKLYHNTIFLNATSSGTNFSTSGIFHNYSSAVANSNLDLRNNIIINKSTPNGTGISVVFRRSLSTDLNNYNTASNNNIFYAGTPSATKLIFYDGTNSDQTLADFQARVSMRETNSKSEDVPFQSIVGSNANFLRIALGTITAAESGATTTTTPAITNDYWGIGRPFASPVNGGTAEDIGASEFDGIKTAGAWVGTTSTDWNVASNWFDGVVPTSTISVVIPSAPTNQPVISSSITATANSIIINAGASLTEQSNSLASIATITNNGTLNYNGTAAQTIGSIATLNNLTVNNPAGITLTAPITVNGVLTFTDGILTTSSPTALLTLSAGATVSGTIDNTRFVNGPITKCGTTAFTFPIGKKGTPNRVGIASIANLSATDCYTAEYFQTPYSNLTVSGALTGVSTGEYWDISRAGATTADLTLNWTDNIFSGVNAGNFDLAKLSMAHFNSTSTFWEVQSTSSLGGTALNGSITAVAVSSFSPFAFGSITSVTLPLAVNTFTATKQNSNTNAINWKATCTGASVSFELQRSSNGIVFVPINSLTATQARCAAPFNYVDNYNATSPITYYKLKVTSNTGEVKYSQIIAINNKNANANTMALYPNITKGNAVLVVESKTTTNANFVITDAKGAIVRRFTENLSEGANAYPINVSSLSAGSYQITGIIDGALKTIRFIKE